MSSVEQQKREMEVQAYLEAFLECGYLEKYFTENERGILIPDYKLKKEYRHFTPEQRKLQFAEWGVDEIVAKKLAKQENRSTSSEED